jgi:hypothetical protein
VQIETSLGRITAWLYRNIKLGGSRDALLASRFVTDECFPGDPTRRGTRSSACRTLFGAMRKVEVITAPKHGFNVHVYEAVDEKQERDNCFEVEKQTEQALDTLRQAVQQGQQRTVDEINGENRRAALAHHQETEARFKVGDVCVHWYPNSSYHGTRLEITEGFDLYRVFDESGPYIDGNGERVSYKYGYCARELGEKSHFYPAHQLRDENWNLRHLQLVGSDNTQRLKAA